MREQTKTAFLGLSNSCLIYLSARASIEFSMESNDMLDFYDPVSLVIIGTGLFVNLCLGIFGLFIVMGFNNYIVSNLPNLIGSYQKAKVEFFLILLNLLTMTFVNLVCIYKEPIEKIDSNIRWLLLGVLGSQVFVMFSCVLVTPDFFNKRFKDFKNRIVSERGDRRTLFI